MRRNDIRNIVIIAHLTTARHRWSIAYCVRADYFANRNFKEVNS